MNKTPEDALCDFWQLWCAQQGIECVSADEIPFDAPLSDAQKEVVRDFSSLWDGMLATTPDAPA